MAFKKPLAALVEAYNEALPDDRRIQPRIMFGCPCAFVGGYMTAGVFQDDLFVRATGATRDQLMTIEGAGPFEPMKGRPMKDYAVLPRDMHDDPPALREWITRAVEISAALPPKVKKAAKAKARPAADKRADVAVQPRAKAGGTRTAGKARRGRKSRA